jgi:hypothetical protein
MRHEGRLIVESYLLQLVSSPAPKSFYNAANKVL